MKVMLLVLGCVLMGIGCTALMSKEPISRSVVLADAPTEAFTRATRALASMGATITQSDRQAGVISAQVHNAVILNVTVAPTQGGSAVQTTCTLMPNKLAFGSVDECDQYTARLQER